MKSSDYCDIDPGKSSAVLSQRIAELEALLKTPQKTCLMTGRDWELTFDAVPDAIAIIDNEHKIVRVNRAMAERLGQSPEAYIGRSCYACIHGLESPPAFCPHSRLLKDGGEQREEVHEVRLGEGDFIVTTTPLIDEEGHIRGSVHVARDITEHKREEAKFLALNNELEKANKDLQAAYQLMRDHRDLLAKFRHEEDVTFFVDREGQIEGITEAAQECIGRSRLQLLGTNVMELFDRNCQARVREALRRSWYGVIHLPDVELVAAKNDQRVFDLKLTRITSQKTRRLSVRLLQHPYDMQKEATADPVSVQQVSFTSSDPR